MQHNQKYAKGATAQKDIQVGETVLMEDCYVHMMHTDETNCCSCGWKEKMNFIPCGNCGDTMYCSQKCLNNNFHKIECDKQVNELLIGYINCDDYKTKKERSDYPNFNCIANNILKLI